MGLATAVADFEANRRRLEGNPVTQTQYGSMVGNILMDLLESSEDPNLRKLAEQTRNIGLSAQEKK